MALWLWAMVGVATGYVVAYRRGFSTAKCVAGGLLLGPLAVLLFLLPADSDVRQQLRCPYCANSVMARARVCQHCGAIIVGG